MSGYHGPDGYRHKPLDDRDERNEWGEPEAQIDEEFASQCAHNDDYDPLGDYNREANL